MKEHRGVQRHESATFLVAEPVGGLSGVGFWSLLLKVCYFVCNLPSASEATFAVLTPGIDWPGLSFYRLGALVLHNTVIYAVCKKGQQRAL